MRYINESDKLLAYKSAWAHISDAQMIRALEARGL